MRLIGRAIGGLFLALLVQERREIALLVLVEQDLVALGGLQDHLGRGEPSRGALGGELDRFARRVAEAETVLGRPRAAGHGPCCRRSAARRAPPSTGSTPSVESDSMTNASDKALKATDVTARHHGLGQLVRTGRHQQEHRIGGRLLQHLQQGVGGSGRQTVRLSDHEHLAARLGSGARGRLPDLLADRVHVDVAALGFDDELVGMLVLQGKPAIATLPAPTAGSTATQPRTPAPPAICRCPRDRPARRRDVAAAAAPARNAMASSCPGTCWSTGICEVTTPCYRQAAAGCSDVHRRPSSRSDGLLHASRTSANTSSGVRSASTTTKRSGCSSAIFR